MIRDVVLHIINEQPLVADIFDRPTPGDTVLVCTNLRSLNGKRPVWIDDSDSIFYFPYGLIRFIEIHADSDSTVALPAGDEAQPSARSRGRTAPPPPPEPEPDLEIDEDFLRRVRDV